MTPAHTVAHQIVPGDVHFANMYTSINSDTFVSIPAEVRDGGPLDGARLIGAPERLGDTRIGLVFSSLYLHGQTYRIRAIGVDPYTLEPAMATKVDHHRLERYGSLALAAVLSGYADALRGTTTISGAGTTVTLTESIPDADDQLLYAVGRVGTAIVPRLQQNMNRPPTVHVSNKNGVGIMFLSPVSIIMPPGVPVTAPTEPDQGAQSATTAQQGEEI